MSATEMTNAAAELIRAFASLLWPLIIACAIYAFRAELRGLLRRLSQLRRGKLFGQEFELDEKLDQLKIAAEKVEEEVATTPHPPDAKRTEFEEQFEERLLRDTGKSPKITLMLLAAELDRKIRELLMATGWHQNIRIASTQRAIEQLRAQGSLPEHVSGSVKLFQEIRNRIIHGGAARDEDILRAIDSGFTLLKAIESIPREKNTVYRTGVPLYSDPRCTQLIGSVKGIMLETTSPGGSQKNLRIFPTTKTHFQLGRPVAWEWSLNQTWGPAWYKDPETSECKQAWQSSGEFVGRHLDEI